ncbi:hypothetical protein [Natrinema sp. H-ect4]|uniref:hypothetical protein n=1 Tax=Natrinema sp. H-ect4 TaxID=3242699 RepID=UPI0035A8FA58
MPNYPSLYLRDEENDHVEEQAEDEEVDLAHTFNGYIRALIQNDMEERGSA